jgi:hypothetical protein
MLSKAPDDRISSTEAMRHPAFEAVMSKSPLIIQSDYDPEELIRMKEYADL